MPDFRNVTIASVGAQNDRFAVVERRIDDERYAGFRKGKRYELVKEEIWFAIHYLNPGATILVHDGRDEIAPMSLYTTCEQHELVTRRLCADLEPFVGVFRQDTRRKRSEIFPVLNLLIEYIAHVRPARIG